MGGSSIGSPSSLLGSDTAAGAIQASLPGLFLDSHSLPALGSGASFAPGAAVVAVNAGAGTQVAVSQILADALQGGQAASGPSLSQLIEHFSPASNGGGIQVSTLATVGADHGISAISVAPGSLSAFGGIGFGHDLSSISHDTLAAMVHAG